MGDESEGGDCDEMICAGWGEPRGQWTVDGMKKGADSTRKVMHMWKSGSWFVMRKIRMVELGWQETTSEFRVLPVDWTEIRLC